MTRELFCEPFTKYVFYSESERIHKVIETLNKKFHEKNQLYLSEYIEEIKKVLPYPVIVNEDIASRLKWCCDDEEYEVLTITTDEMRWIDIPVKMINYDKTKLKLEVE